MGYIPRGICFVYGYAVYSNITRAFWQIRYDRQEGFHLSSKGGKISREGEE
jgi:hypothetical protein